MLQRSTLSAWRSAIPVADTRSGIELGFISGMKSYVVMPFVVVSIVYYAMRRASAVAASGSRSRCRDSVRRNRAIPIARNTDPDFDRIILGTLQLRWLTQGMSLAK